ncbi:MAG: hypothetical protein ACOCPN_03110 [Desulfonatronovibrionaceae bacterium]
MLVAKEHCLFIKGRTGSRAKIFVLVGPEASAGGRYVLAKT